ncbi:MAG: hypothetical protein SangKO_040150 [Sandaracinaceae bacterium]
MKRASLMILLGLLFGCDQSVEPLRPSPVDAGPPVCPESPNDAIRLALEPTCGSCHGEGSVRPFFESLRSFEDLLVYEPRYVTPGDPDGSLFIALLEGRGDGAYDQMPLGGEPFAARAGTRVTVEALRAWIEDLPPRVVNEAPDPGAIATRPLRAEEMVTSLADQLGLSLEDDFIRNRGTSHDNPTVVMGGRFAVRTPDAAEGLHYGRDAVVQERFVSLGGPSWLSGVARREEVSADFMVTLVQMSQAWCHYAIEEQRTDALFRHVDADAASAESDAEIRQNLEYVYLRMLGEPPPADEIDALYTELFVPLEAETSPRRAWVAVCAAMVRHPLWMTY